ncbi:hypothetical protein Scep_016190 [Stephania cephalantha]|uniref:Potassium channel n=1 Tax=Stephania cephalantha TaxID=152367 RepID=A0AAP0IP31_9MAGN
MTRGVVGDHDDGEKDDHELEDSDFQVESVRDRLHSSRASRFELITNEFYRFDKAHRGFSRERVIDGIRGFSQGFVILPNNRFYRVWTKIILLWAIYSSVFTPIEFGFFRGLPKNLHFLDIAGQVAFLIDIVLQFFVAFRDKHTYLMIGDRTPIAFRYLKSTFIIDFLSCLPWDVIYRKSGKKEVVRYLLWIRLIRVRKVTEFFQQMEKDIRINYLFTRIVKLITVEVYCTHTAACIFYHLATTVPANKEGYTWIGSLKLGDYSYSNFREIDFGKRYLTSLYFAIVTMATVGYGDIHAVNIREMIFIMIYVSFDMILGAYLIGNMTALIVKGSKTVRFRDKMTDLLKYMNRNKLGKDIRDQIKGHVRLEYESSYTELAVLQDLPASIRAKISQTLYKPYIEEVSLFRGCSPELKSQIVIRLHEEFFLPGEVLLEQGSAVDQLYFVCQGMLEEVGRTEDGSEETVSSLPPYSSFGELSILFNIPQPYTVQVLELCRLLRIDKQSFMNVLDIYSSDAQIILKNVLEGKESMRIKQFESDITFHIGKQEAELASRVNIAAFQGDLYRLKELIRGGAHPNKTDYDGRSPLHLAASRGYEDITLFLIELDGVDINIPDKFGNTPLFEAIKNGHDRVASLLTKHGASLDIDDGGNCLCLAVAKGDSDFLKRLLSNGVDPNSRDYDHRTPLHVAAAEGLYLMAKLLLEAGASVFLKDRWGRTPLDEARSSGNNKLIELLEVAKSTQAQLLDCTQEFQERTVKKRCTVFPFHPQDPKESRRVGIALWVPHSMDELIKEAAKQLRLTGSSYIIVSEDVGKILDVDMISDGQKLYVLDDEAPQT